MCRILLIVIVMAMLVGCAHSQTGPIAPSLDVRPCGIGGIDDPHRLWGEFTLYFSGDHSRVEIAPKRLGRLHLNSTKFLEDYCKDCLEVTNIVNNGDGTIDLAVRITHPFPGHPEYTGFDVKGIIMFNASVELKWDSEATFPFYDPIRVSWREKGDPEVLNPDGYSPRWSPWWDSGSSMPIFNYWPGKFSKGTPTANVNAFLNFYTDEDRHMFQCNGQVERTYHISLPGGAVTAGYAIEACWEPATVTPVTNPVDDFPFSANQREPYYFEYVLNNNEVITQDNCCGTTEYDCEKLWLEYLQWYGEVPNILSARYWDYESILGGPLIFNCPPVDPPPIGIRATLPPQVVTYYFGNGSYRGAAALFYYGPPSWEPGVAPTVAYDIFDFVIDND